MARWSDPDAVRRPGTSSWPISCRGGVAAGMRTPWVPTWSGHSRWAAPTSTPMRDFPRHPSTVNRAEERRLRSLQSPAANDRLIGRSTLMGSYPLIAELRALQEVPTEWLYVDNGASVMERSTHCNTAVHRWTLRERGVVLAGPQPRSMTAPVKADQLRAEARTMADEYLTLLQADWHRPDSAWDSSRTSSPPTAASSRTVATVRVASKGDALQWGLADLDDDWHPLIRAALDDRPGLPRWSRSPRGSPRHRPG